MANGASSNRCSPIRRAASRASMTSHSQRYLLGVAVRSTVARSAEALRTPHHLLQSLRPLARLSARLLVLHVFQPLSGFARTRPEQLHRVDMFACVAPMPVVAVCFAFRPAATLGAAVHAASSASPHGGRSAGCPGSCLRTTPRRLAHARQPLAGEVHGVDLIFH